MDIIDKLDLVPEFRTFDQLHWYQLDNKEPICQEAIKEIKKLREKLDFFLLL